ncbi:MAG TPA: hypothetical protein VMP89_05995 [Solirubrobacteraceae bacterium]|nr:hypothetical protein [Solirubrobacteraceae bacterium]
MTREGAHTAILTSALVVGATYAIRKLIEPAASTPYKPAETLTDHALSVVGAEPSPAAVGQFATGFGFTFVTLAVVGTFAPSLAGSMAALIAVSNTLINGGAIFTDISHQAGVPEAKHASSTAKGKS